MNSSKGYGRFSISYMAGILVGSLFFCSLATGQTTKQADTIQLKPIQVDPHT